MKSLAVFLLSLSILFLTLLYLMAVKQHKVDPQEVKPFCCPGEVKILTRYLNTSLSPCRDFFQYVCSNAKKYQLQSYYSRMVSKNQLYESALSDISKAGEGTYLI